MEHGVCRSKCSRHSCLGNAYAAGHRPVLFWGGAGSLCSTEARVKFEQLVGDRKPSGLSIWVLSYPFYYFLSLTGALGKLVPSFEKKNVC